tara:strand:+ start:1454 stop:3364 length:1911 start_codon:yes stop_codon:yes gene_type:complete
MNPALKKYVASMADALPRCFKFRAAMSAPAWAESVRRMDGGRRYRFDFAPYQREMMETPFKPEVQKTVFQCGSRLGKTETVMNILGHSISEAPRRILVLYPTTSQAEKWSKETLEKELFEPTPALQWLVRGGRRNSSNTILHKLFPGGLINIFGANSPGEMRRAKGSLLFCDEVDAIQESDGQRDEGDQLEIFWMRGSEYSDAIRIAASYPSIEGRSRIAKMMAESDFRKWFTPCFKCKKPFVMLRDHVHWPQGKPEKAYMECPECGERLTDKMRRKMIAGGEWRATQPFTGTAGFFLNGMCSPHPVQRGFKSHFHWIASQVEAIEKSDNPERSRHVFINTFDALPYRPERIEAPEPNVILARREDYKPWHELPEEVLVVTAGVDVQKRWLEAAVWGWGEGKQSWLLDHKKITGAPDDPGTWLALESYLVGCRYPHPSGAEIGIFDPGTRVMVDAGYWDQHVLPWTFSKQAVGVAAVQGSPTINAPILGKMRFAHQPKARIYSIGVNQAKDIIYQRLALPKPEAGQPFPPGYIHLNDTATPSFVEGLTCEYGKREMYRGELFTRYINKPGARNEPLDTFVYALAGAIALNPRFDRIRENLPKRAAPGKAKQPAPAAKTATRKRAKKKRGGFIGGFS